jgi:ribonuclease BN (tRNA processing enzyme)
MIPDAKSPFLIYNELNDGESVTINKKTFTSLPANHVVPANGYQISGSAGTLVFTGDTAGGEFFWDAVNKIKDLKYLIIETAFSNAEADLASISKHLCPNSLALELTHLKSNPEIFITHLKPGEDATIIKEIATNPKTQHCKALRQNQIFDL